TLLCDTEGGLPLNGAVTPAYWVLVTEYGDDRDKLRRLFARFQRLARPLRQMISLERTVYGGYWQLADMRGCTAHVCF
ncbi:MAG: hypothetical protein WCD30_05900, partial [Pseudolabrys sp.]